MKRHDRPLTPEKTGEAQDEAIYFSDISGLRVAASFPLTTASLAAQNSINAADSVRAQF